MTNTTELQTSRTHPLRTTTTLAALAALWLGVVMTPSVKAQSFNVLYSFKAGEDGATPYAALVMGSAGNLYGTTVFGGSSNVGTVFKLDRSGNETVLHTFTGGDGAGPYSGLIMGKGGTLYGTTNGEGTSGNGTVFKLDTSDNETVLHNFAGSPDDGGGPIAALIMDKAGNLYSTTHSGGAGTCSVPELGCGTVFKLDTSGNETVLYKFVNSDGDGTIPTASLITDKAGNLYSTTINGGDYNCNSPDGCGTVFKLDTSGNETVLHSFAGSPDDGAVPYGALIMDKAGNLYGTTSAGGAFGYGTVFKLTP